MGTILTAYFFIILMLKIVVSASQPIKPYMSRAVDDLFCAPLKELLPQQYSQCFDYGFLSITEIMQAVLGCMNNCNFNEQTK